MSASSSEEERNWEDMELTHYDESEAIINTTFVQEVELTVTKNKKKREKEKWGKPIAKVLVSNVPIHIEKHIPVNFVIHGQTELHPAVALKCDVPGISNKVIGELIKIYARSIYFEADTGSNEWNQVFERDGAIYTTMIRCAGGHEECKVQGGPVTN